VCVLPAPTLHHRRCRDRPARADAQLYY